MWPTYGIKLEITGGSLGSYLGLNRWTTEAYMTTSSSEIPTEIENRLVSILTAECLYKMIFQK